MKTTIKKFYKTRTLQIRHTKYCQAAITMWHQYHEKKVKDKAIKKTLAYFFREVLWRYGVPSKIVTTCK